MEIDVIKNFLDKTDAETLFEIVHSYRSEEWIYMFSGKTYLSYVSLLDSEENAEEVEREFLRIEDVFDTSIRGFRFKEHCNFSNIDDFVYKFIRSDKFTDNLKKAINIEGTIVIKSSFVSKYEDGDYAGIHKDTGRGQYSFTYQLTKNWNPNHGGFLSFWDSKISTIYKTIYPEYNSITIFKVQPDSDPDHFVTRVCGPSSRIAITGWFDIM